MLLISDRRFQPWNSRDIRIKILKAMAIALEPDFRHHAAGISTEINYISPLH
jgi:hypothetical protein